MKETTTTNLAKFGWREWKLLRELIDAVMDQGLPRDFHDDGVVPMMNFNSGFVFLTNENFDTAMMNGDKLESFYTCHECGHEGFFEDMQHNEGNRECQEYYMQIKDNQS